MADYEGINSDYIKEPATSLSKIKNNKFSLTTIKEELPIDTKAYGVSKPKRIVVRARIVDDKG